MAAGVAHGTSRALAVGVLAAASLRFPPPAAGPRLQTAPVVELASLNAAAVVEAGNAAAVIQAPPVELEAPGAQVASAPDAMSAAASIPLEPTPTTRPVSTTPAPPAKTPSPASATRPARPTTLYDMAARQYGVSPAVLEALHTVESSGAGDGCLPNQAGSGAIGPFQFKPATFRAYGVDADGDGRADICGFVDSLFSAARYLHALGADTGSASPVTVRALDLYGTASGRVVSAAIQ
ncbi:MAG: lytic murein transglycosylase [Chloroflexi bacterium]|nr:lytic murein transglycosylase [Chloroflexota bacterium]